jgi:Skp family chaperone for outer membrane proteins
MPEAGRLAIPPDIARFGRFRFPWNVVSRSSAVRDKQRSARAVKKLIASLSLAAIVVGTLILARTGEGQDAATQAAAPAGGPHQIGLIDMAQVFKEYDKFKAQSDALRQEVEDSDAEAQAMVTAMQQLQAQLTSGQLQEGSADYSAIEQQLLEKQSQLDTFRKMKQREFLRKEADIYKTVYLEVQDAVEKYAKYYKYTLIMRFNRSKVEDAENPQDIIQSMNRPVVFYRDNDDLTDPILNYLNQQYSRTAGQPAATGAAGATARPGQ